MENIKKFIALFEPADFSQTAVFWPIESEKEIADAKEEMKKQGIDRCHIYLRDIKKLTTKKTEKIFVL